MVFPKQKDIEKNKYPLKNNSNVRDSSDGTMLNNRVIISPNYAQSAAGWRLDSNGKVDSLTETKLSGILTETNFRKILTEPNTGVSIWVSDGTDPDGNLTGVVGDICLNGAGGVAFYCDTAGKNWTAM